MHEASSEKILQTLAESGLRMRPASLVGGKGAIPWKLIETVFAKDRGCYRKPFGDPWDAVSRHYLLTRHDHPVGGLRIVDPGSLLEVPGLSPPPFERRRLPVEKQFSLQGKIVDVVGFFAGGRMVLAADSHHTGAFMVILATAYLHAQQVEDRHPRAESISDSENAPEQKRSSPHAEAFYAPHYHYPDNPLMIKTDEVPAGYRALFQAMEARGLIER